MSTIKKAILFFLVCTSVILGGILLFPYLKLTSIPLFNNLPKANPISSATKAKYGNIDTSQLVNYVEKTVKIPYRPNRSYLTTFKNGVVSNNRDYVTFSTNPWDINKTSTSVELTQSLKGKTYSENGLLHDYTIYAKTKNDRNESLENLLKKSITFFAMPAGIDLSKYKSFEAEIGGKVLEVTWRDTNLNTIESRSVWDTNEGDMVYFIACRVFKDSPLYKENTCYYKKKI